MATLRSRSGRVLTDEAIEQLPDRMERGYDPEQLRPRRSGRPSLGEESPSPRIQVRVSRRLFVSVNKRARDEGRTVSALARQLLENYASGGTPSEG